MKYNPKAQECQIFMDIDCGNWNYNSDTSPALKEAAEKALKKAEEAEEKQKNDRMMEEFPELKELQSQRSYTMSDSARRMLEMSLRVSMMSRIGREDLQSLTKGADLNRTETIKESLNKSLLKHLNLKKVTSADELEEAFCRDIDSFNSAYITDDGSRPQNCTEISEVYCAVLYDSKSCEGGWNLNVTDNDDGNFFFFSSNWKYRNDIDTIGVRYGCTFTGFTSTDFSGNKMIITADSTDRWIVLADNESYKKFDE